MPQQDDEGRYESFQRMSWIDEGGIDLRAARANLIEFVLGLYQDALNSPVSEENTETTP